MSTLDEIELMTACKADNYELVIQLLEKHGLDLDDYNPLYYASQQGYDKVVEILLRHGCDPNVQNKAGDCPINAAIRNHLNESVRLLLNFGANPNINDVSHENSVHSALYFKNAIAMQMLLDAGADPNIECPVLGDDHPYEIDNIVDEVIIVYEKPIPITLRTLYYNQEKGACIRKLFHCISINKFRWSRSFTLHFIREYLEVQTDTFQSVSYTHLTLPTILLV